MKILKVRRKSKKPLWLIFKGFILIASLIIIRIFLFEIKIIKSISMQNSLDEGNFVVVNKLIYGPLIPNNVYDVPWIGSVYSHLIRKSPLTYFNHKRLSGFRNPKRGDIVVFKHFSNNSSLIKRCLGLPGDKVDLDSLKVLSLQMDPVELSVRNNTPAQLMTADHKKQQNIIEVPERDVSYFIDDQFYLQFKEIIQRFEEKNLVKKFGQYFLDGNQVETFVFKQDYYFMLGDNTQHSIDSRHFGVIPKSCIIGLAINMSLF